MANKREAIIISHLRENSRKSLTEISSQTKIPVTTVYCAVNRLRKRGIIHKTAAILDFQKIGFNARVNLALKAEKRKELAEFLSQHPNTNSISRTNNGFDFFVDAVFQNLADYESFKKEIKKFGLTNINEHHIIEEIKREGVLIT